MPAHVHYSQIEQRHALHSVAECALQFY